MLEHTNNDVCYDGNSLQDTMQNSKRKNNKYLHLFLYNLSLSNTASTEKQQQYLPVSLFPLLFLFFISFVIFHFLGFIFDLNPYS